MPTYVLLLGGQFVTTNGGRSNEYPDAKIYDTGLEALEDIKDYRGFVEVYKDYGTSDEKTIIAENNRH